MTEAYVRVLLQFENIFVTVFHVCQHCILIKIICILGGWANSVVELKALDYVTPKLKRRPNTLVL
jgi:hypothetical protein